MFSGRNHNTSSYLPYWFGHNTAIKNVTYVNIKKYHFQFKLKYIFYVYVRYTNRVKKVVGVFNMFSEIRVLLTILGCLWNISISPMGGKNEIWVKLGVKITHILKTK